MTRRTLFIAVAVTAGLMFGATWQVSRVAAARRDFESSNVRLAQATSDVRELIALRSKTDSVAIGKRPEQDMLARVHGALDEAGVPQSAFIGQSQESDSAAPGSADNGGPNYRRQIVRLSFKSLLPKQLGALLAVWHRGQSVWIPTRIDLSHTAGDSAAYDATILVTAVYLDDSAVDGRPSGGTP